MVEIRAYSAANGRCLAGNRHSDYRAEQQRVRADFGSRIRCVIDTNLGEVRAYVPTVRQSAEAFHIVVQFHDDISLRGYVEAVRALFSKHESWAIRTESPEAAVLGVFETGELPAPDQQPPNTIPDRPQTPVELGVGTYQSAAETIRKLYSTSEVSGHWSTYAIGAEDIPQHLNPDIYIHVGEQYDGVELVLD